jgi:hypothetical protein
LKCSKLNFISDKEFQFFVSESIYPCRVMGMDMDMQQRYVFAAWTWTCSMDVGMHGHGHAACTGTCSLDMVVDMQH